VGHTDTHHRVQNPFASTAVLFRSGPALRRLSLAACSYCACTSIWGTLDPFRMASFGWTAAENSVFTSCLFLTSAISQSLFIPVLLRSMGNLRAFQSWSLVAGLAYFCVGQAGRPRGASKLRKSLQYLAPALVLQDPWTDPCSHAIRALVVKQGIDSTSAGRGELSAAFDGITDVVGCVMPMVWGQLFNFFSTQSAAAAAAAAATPTWLAATASFLGIGGHFLLAALLRLGSGAIAFSIPHRTLAPALPKVSSAEDIQSKGFAALRRIPSLTDVRSGRRSGAGDITPPRLADMAISEGGEGGED
jgi:hypothetical protein